MLAHFVNSLSRPQELWALYRLILLHRQYKPDSRNLRVLAQELEDLEFCYATLSKVSRSFSVVIQQLPTELRDAVCVFYLVLRGLDTIEDDTGVPPRVRRELLLNFHNFHYDPQWQLHAVGDSDDYRALLENYSLVTSAFRKLSPKYQEVILSICESMGQGMVQFLDKEIETTADYDQYCHYVAGLVGIGLSQLFVQSGLEHRSIGLNRTLANSMGLFLQKTNIIRDYHEDILCKRTFWPKEIWGDYGQNLTEFRDRATQNSLACLNHMITDALRHASDCLTYLEKLKDPQIFGFCAIPQVMAIATLAEVYNNSLVFKQNVKIRKGLAATLILGTKSYEDVVHIFKRMSQTILRKIEVDKENADSMLAQSRLHEIINWGEQVEGNERLSVMMP